MNKNKAGCFAVATFIAIFIYILCFSAHAETSLSDMKITKVSGVTVCVNTLRFELKGETYKELQRSLAKSKFCPNGGMAAIEYSIVRNPLEGYPVGLIVLFIYPKPKSSATLSKCDRAKWDAFLTRLEDHERSHFDVALDAAIEILANPGDYKKIRKKEMKRQREIDNGRKGFKMPETWAFGRKVKKDED